MDRQLSENKVVADGSLPVEGSIVEVSILLETWQLAALETSARGHGLTAGALIRCLLRDYVTGIEDEARPPCLKDGAADPLEASVCSLAKCTDI